MLTQMNGKVRSKTSQELTMGDYDRAIIACLLRSNADPSDSRFGALSPEECGVLNRVMLRSAVNP